MNEHMRQVIQKGIEEGRIKQGKPGEGYIKIKSDISGEVIYDSRKDKTPTTDEWFNMMFK